MNELIARHNSVDRMLDTLDPALITPEEKQLLLSVIANWGEDSIPENTIRFINAHPEIFKEDMINALNALILSKEIPDTMPDMPIAALYTLSHYQAKEAFPLLIELLHVLNSEQLDEIFGDILIEHGDFFLNALFDGNFQLLQDLIRDKQAYFYNRTVSLSALNQLIYHGHLQEEEVILFLDNEARRLIEENKDDLDSENAEIVDWVLMYLAELDCDKAEQIVNSYQWNLSRYDIFDMESIKREPRFFYHKQRFDMLPELLDEGLFFIRTFRGYEREYKPDYNWRSSRLGWKGYNTVVNENKIGRNDPCSCGSGKKYKKCCLM